MHQKLKTYKTKNMKKYLLIFVMLLGTVSSWGQSVADQAAVLQKCIMAPQLNNLIKCDPTGVPVSLYLVQGSVAIPANLDVNYFGRKAEIVTQAEIISRSADSYFSFNRLDISQNTANVTFDFVYNCNSGKQVIELSLELQKTGGEWTISQTKETRR